MPVTLETAPVTNPRLLRQRVEQQQHGQIVRRQLLLLLSALLLVVVQAAMMLPATTPERTTLVLAWLVMSLAALALHGLLGVHVRHHASRMSSQMALWVLTFQCVLLGGVAGSTVLITGAYRLPVTHMPVFTGLLLLFHMLALVVLSVRIQAFLVVFGLSMLPYLACFWLDIPWPEGYWVQLFYVLVMLLITAYLRQLHNQFIWLGIRNEDLLSHADSQREFAALTRLKLEHEISDRLTISQQLQQANLLLEQKVEERTSAIRSINHHLTRSRHNLEIAHRAAGIGSWDWDIHNRELECLNFESILGYDAHENSRMMSHMQALVHPDDYTAARRALVDHLRNKSERYEARFRIRHKQGHWLWVQDMGQVIERDARTQLPLRMVGIRRDIHDEIDSEERLRLSASVFEQAAEGIFILDAQFRYLDCNRRYEQLLGQTRNALFGEHLGARSIDRPSIHGQYLRLLQTLTQTGEIDEEINEHDANGQPLNLGLHINAIKGTHGHITHYIGIVSDLTERRQNEQRLSYMANYDELTALPNRNLFRSQLHQMILESTQDHDRFVLLRLDIDRFGLINDSLGTEQADTLLRLVAQRLNQVNRDANLVARLGSDDFAILLDVFTGPAIERQVQQYCEQLILAFETPFMLAEQEVLATLSVGVAIYPDHGRQLNVLLNHAEKALHEAKRRGGSTQMFYSEEQGGQAIERIQLENALRKAITNDELAIYYQPKFSLASGRLSGFEALVRWLHPQNGLMSPALFIPIAEESGLISQLGEQVLERVCMQLRQWLDAGIEPQRISVNVVAQQFQRGNFLDVLDRLMGQHRIPGRLLELELTETSLMDRPERVRPLLDQIRARSLQISLDDFGTGYSSLSYLQQFPIDTIKIDRSFISEVGRSPRHEAIVRAILAMGHTLGMKVVAEGVENQEQALFLKREGCDYVQGYYTSMPLPALETEGFLLGNVTHPPLAMN